jgi:hypothetical protein
MSDKTEKHCMCGCIYLESDCPNCNKVTDADRIEELEAKGLANRVAIMRLEAKLAKAMEIIEAYGEDEGYIPQRVADIYDEMKGKTDE